MKINGEEVELVTDFASLRAGMIVIIKPCQWCNCTAHRGLLCSKETDPNVIGRPGAQRQTKIVWTYLPQSCTSERIRRSVVGPETVSSGRLFRVVDRDINPETVTRAKELAR